MIAKGILVREKIITKLPCLEFCALLCSVYVTLTEFDYELLMLS